MIVNFAYSSAGVAICRKHYDSPPGWLPALGGVADGRGSGCVCCAYDSLAGRIKIFSKNGAWYFTDTESPGNVYGRDNAAEHNVIFQIVYEYLDACVEDLEWLSEEYDDE